MTPQGPSENTSSPLHPQAELFHPLGDFLQLASPSSFCELRPKRLLEVGRAWVG